MNASMSPEHSLVQQEDYRKAEHFFKKKEIPHNPLPAGDALRAPDGVGGRCTRKSYLGKKFFFAKLI